MLPRVLVLSVLLLVVSGARAADDPAKHVDKPVDLTYRDDKLSLHVHDRPVADVLGELVKQSGAELKGTPSKTSTVSAEIDAVPLHEALNRLLGDNFTLRYGDDGKLKTIELKGGPEEARKVPTPPDIVYDNDAPTPESWRRAYQVFFNGRPRVPISGRFAKLIDSQDAGWDMVVNTAYGYRKDAKVRREAVRAGLKAIEADPDFQQAIMDTVGKMDDVDLANFALHNCKFMCEDLVKNIARETHVPAFRTRAYDLLRQLRKMPKPDPLPMDAG